MGINFRKTHPPLFFKCLRRLFDPWSVPHFLFGMVIAMGAIALHWPLFASFLALMVVAFLWEYVERKIGIRERKGNPLMDIMLPILAFGMTLLLVDQAPLHDEEHFALFMCVLLLFVSLNLIAWRARLQKERGFLH